MKSVFYQLFFFLLLSVAAYAQEPAITWGPAVEKDPRTLQNMHVVGSTDGQSFYAVYLEEGQATLERYDQNSQRLWATALLPKTPSNQPATFYDVVLLQNRLYLLSTFRAKGTTTVYAQEIAPNGNYGTSVQTVLNAEGNGKLHIAVANNKAALLATLSETTSYTITSTLLNNELQPRWSQTLKGQGSLQQTLLLNNGTALLLSSAPATAQNPFVLHRLGPQNGKPEQLSMAHEQFRPIQAKMAATLNQELIVSGYYAPVAEAAEQNPEPRGTFYFHFGKEPDSKPVSAFTPFNAVFLREYKRFKPDADKIQRLRNLQLRQVIPLATGGAFVIGEVAYLENTNGSRTFHNDDVVVVRLNNAGGSVYATSANKLQSSVNDNGMLSSYLVTTNGESVHILYLDFEYNYTAENRIIIAGPNSLDKAPVLVTIPPTGKPQQVTPLHQSQTGRASDFYLRPSSAYPLSDKEIVVLGIGKDYYKYGKLKLE